MPVEKRKKRIKEDVFERYENFCPNKTQNHDPPKQVSYLEWYFNKISIWGWGGKCLYGTISVSVLAENSSQIPKWGTRPAHNKDGQNPDLQQLVLHPYQVYIKKN